MQKIGLLGGTFDPIHRQHLKIAKVAYQKLKLDEIWIVPTKQNPLKYATMATNEQRIAMIEIAIADFDFIKLVKYEIEQPTADNYTIDTIIHFRKTFPDYQFYFLLGADNLANLHKWKAIDDLCQLVQFVIVNRKNYNKNHKVMQQYHCHDLQILPSLADSSSLIRSGESICSLNPKVLSYINQNLLYVESRLRHHLDETRYQHSINVGLMSQKLAQHYQVNEQQALIAGTYHDIAKQWSIHQLKSYLKNYEPDLLNHHHNLYHAYAGAYYLKYHYRYQDEAIIKAVMKHTTGDVTMSQLDLIVFLADKISIERNYPGVEALRTLAFSNLEAAFVSYLKFLKQNLLSRHATLSKDFNLIYHKWVEEEQND